MKLWVKILPVFFFFYLISPLPAFSRSGCCSHHGGVCGCRCCDGSALLAKCAPYYPSCNSKPIIPTHTLKPTVTSTDSLEVLGSIDGSDSNQDSDNNDGSTVSGLLLAGAGYGGYSILKNKKRKIS